MEPRKGLRRIRSAHFLIWYFNGDTEIVEGGPMKISKISADDLLEDPHTVIQGDRVLHFRYRVRR